MENLLLIAVGGNALLHAGQRGSLEQESANACRIAEVLADVVQNGYRIVLTHGNGPQIGSQLLRSEAGSGATYPLTLDLCVSMTQGEIGYLLQRSLQTALRKRGLEPPVITLITQVVVDTADGSFRRPTKPIGPVLTREMAVSKRDELGWSIVEEAPRKYRRSVPSPRPLEILELEAIKRCLRENMIVIAAGGGGVPVVRDNGEVRGVEAVIDKDRVSALLAGELHVDRFVMLTDVECAFLNFGMIDEQPISIVTMEEALVHLSAGHFGEGSMKPKVESAVEFLARGGKEAIITDVPHLLASLRGDAGTRIVSREDTIN